MGEDRELTRPQAGARYASAHPLACPGLLLRFVSGSAGIPGLEIPDLPDTSTRPPPEKAR